MADYFPANIRIGGPIPRTILNDLISTILAEGASCDDYGGPEYNRDELRKDMREGVTVPLFNDRACCGQFKDLEAFLVKHGIHFDRHSDSYREFNAENVFYRGGPECVVMLADQDGHNLVRCCDVLEILDDTTADDQARLKAIRHLVAPPETETLTTIRFV